MYLENAEKCHTIDDLIPGHMQSRHVLREPQQPGTDHEIFSAFNEYSSHSPQRFSILHISLGQSI